MSYTLVLEGTLSQSSGMSRRNLTNFYCGVPSDGATVTTKVLQAGETINVPACNFFYLYVTSNVQLTIGTLVAGQTHSTVLNVARLFVTTAPMTNLILTNVGTTPVESRLVYG